MKRFVSLVFAVGLGVAAGAGCSDQRVGKLDKLADRACACQDKACAEQVAQDFHDFLSEGMKDRVSEEAKKELGRATHRLGTCVAKFLEPEDGEAGAAPAAADDPADEAASEEGAATEETAP
jgi:hypothetical protein